MRIALISLNQRWLDKEANFDCCADFVFKAAKQGCALVIFPEMTLTGYSLEMENVAEPTGKAQTLQRFEKLALEAKVDIVFGMSLVDTSARACRNTLCHARCQGSAEVVYAKIHPFSFVGEDKVLEAGQALGETSIGELRLGCSICYDLRFPELFAVMARECNAIVNIANWPGRRVNHWRALLIARAIENQLFVFGVNRIGTDGNGLQYEKSSMAVAPDGVVLEPFYSEAEMDIYEIKVSETERYRNSFPTLRDKRYALYGEFYRRIL